MPKRRIDELSAEAIDDLAEEIEIEISKTKTSIEFLEIINKLGKTISNLFTQINDNSQEDNPHEN